MITDDICECLITLQGQNEEPHLVEVSYDIMTMFKSISYPEMMNGFTSRDCSELYGFKVVENCRLPVNTVRFLNQKGESILTWRSNGS